MCVRDLVRYLVVQRLLCNNVVVLAVKEYFVDGLGPSTIGHRYRVSKYVVRGWVQRSFDKVRSHYVVASVVRAVFPYIMDLDPVVLRVNGHYCCLLCDAELVGRERARRHLVGRHGDYVESLVDEVLRRARSSEGVA